MLNQETGATGQRWLHELCKSLSSRELQMAALIADGHRNADIASHLGLSVRTVEVHVTHLCEKLEARTRTHAVVLLMRAGKLS